MKFSIITACHNQEKYIEQCINSIIDQDHKDWELFVLDDASSDSTYDRACRASKKDGRVRVLRNSRRLYCGATYNKLVSYPTGDVCGVVDGDDALLPNSMSTVLGYYNKHPELDFIWTNHYWYNTKMLKFRRGISNKPKRKTIFDSEKGLRHVYSHWRTFRTYLREKAQLFDPRLKCTVDKNLGYVLEELGMGGYIDQMLYKYRYHDKNMSQNGSQQKLKWAHVRKWHKNKKRFRSVVIG